MNAEDLLYCDTHEWVYVSDQDGQKIATVGISAFAVEQLTDLVYMELPSIGTAVTVGEEFGEVESVKAVSPLYSPVTGTVTAVNEGLPDNLDILNTDPYEAGWIMKVAINDDLSDSLLNYNAYQNQCGEAS
ncbi:MAG: glycine cleavage system protein GcvH [Planctomycetota bacterium]|nr:glycine cleavage system protein GcvH [Planctomycetota bacterium]